MAANQGLYNGFLAAGLFWSLLARDKAMGRKLAIFFLGCVIVAALFGAGTVNWTILLKQGLPGTIAMAALLLS